MSTRKLYSEFEEPPKELHTITDDQIKRLDENLPEGVYVTFGRLPVTDEAIEDTINTAPETIARAKAKYPEKFSSV